MIVRNAYRGSPAPSIVKRVPETKREAPPKARRFTLPPKAGMTLYLWLFDIAKRGEKCPTNVEIAERFGAASGSTGRSLVSDLETLGLIEVKRGHMSRRVYIRELDRWTA